MSPEHKAAMAAGRSEARVVRVYLEALRSNKPKKGRKRTPDSIAKRLKAIEAELAAADAMNELKLTQERLDLQAELESMGNSVDIGELEAEFVKVAASYSARAGISYSAWRAVGVTPATLKSAGIKRSS